MGSRGGGRIGSGRGRKIFYYLEVCNVERIRGVYSSRREIGDRNLVIEIGVSRVCDVVDRGLTMGDRCS